MTSQNSPKPHEPDDVPLDQHGIKEGDISKFIEDAVKWRVLDTNVAAFARKNQRVTGATVP